MDACLGMAGIQTRHNRHNHHDWLFSMQTGVRYREQQANSEMEEHS